MIGERTKRARAAAGLSMAALAKMVGVSANMIKKYEHDESMPSSKVLLKLAEALSVRTEYFFRPAKIALGNVEYRKKANTSQKLLKRIEADVLDQAERWFELERVWPNFPVPTFSFDFELPSIDSIEDIEQVADKVREYWKLGVNPLPELIDLLESKGILVITSQVQEDAKKIDGLQAKIHGKPVVFVSSSWPGCRQRFTLAHELGHLLLHDLLPSGMDEEKACNRFASSFLLPQAGAYQHLGEKRSTIDFKELYLLKHEYGLSMQACLYRARDLNIISSEYTKSSYILFSKNGWRTKEPGDAYPKERTYLFEQLVHRAVSEEIISESKAAELLKIPTIELRRKRWMTSEGAD